MKIKKFTMESSGGGMDLTVAAQEAPTQAPFINFNFLNTDANK